MDKILTQGRLGDGDPPRIRSEPDAQADNFIRVIGEGEMVTMLAKGKKAPTESPWFKVRLKDGTEGWVDSGFLSAVTDTAVIAEAEAADKAAKEAEKAAAQAQKEREAALKSGKAVLAPESDFEVKLNDAGDGAVITKYVGPGGNIIIPATIQGMPVTEVYMNPPMRKVGTGEYNTFTSKQIRSIEDVERVGEKTEKTIDVNTTLISVEIPEGVWRVGGFWKCIALRSVTLPDSLTKLVSSDYTGAFQGCTSLASITIPGSVTEIGVNAFSGCTSLASVTIPDSVTTIDDRAFYGCTSLASVTIPDSVTTIGDYAFYGRMSLTSIAIPEGVTAIGQYAFFGCTSLASVTIPEGVTAIGQYAFQYCTSLASVTIPDSVTTIYTEAFSGCTSLVTVTISPIKRKWDAYWGGAFANCPKVNLASQAALKAAGYTGGF